MCISLRYEDHSTTLQVVLSQFIYHFPSHPAHVGSWGLSHLRNHVLLLFFSSATWISNTQSVRMRRRHFRCAFVGGGRPKLDRRHLFAKVKIELCVGSSIGRLCVGFFSPLTRASEPLLANWPRSHQRLTPKRVRPRGPSPSAPSCGMHGSMTNSPSKHPPKPQSRNLANSCQRKSGAKSCRVLRSNLKRHLLVIIAKSCLWSFSTTAHPFPVHIPSLLFLTPHVQRFIGMVSIVSFAWINQH